VKGFPQRYAVVAWSDAPQIAMTDVTAPSAPRWPSEHSHCMRRAPPASLPRGGTA
jgi:hypothetical protein